MAVAAAFLSSGISHAGDLSGKIYTIAPYLGNQNKLYLRLTGTPGNAQPDGSPSGSCSDVYAVADMTDPYFKGFVYPLIVLAKAADSFITLRTLGCSGPYPAIVGVDYPPR